MGAQQLATGHCSGKLFAYTNAFIFLNFLFLVQGFLRRVVLAASCPAVTCHRPILIYLVLFSEPHVTKIDELTSLK